ncbi:MAG: ThiF family adenylyltransferase [Verrucomicrobiota bacterium]|nr:ThiF family adenylyltransferase [Verrucomicrobiota bacterium]
MKPIAQSTGSRTRRSGADAQRPERAARFPKLVGMCADGAAALGGLRVAIVGCGSVGGRVALHLARCGVRGLVLIDPKKYRPVSLLTHECYPEAIGKNKADVIATLCRRICPDLEIRVYVKPVQDLSLAGLVEADVVVMATDNLPAEVDTGQRCIWLGKPLVHAALHGETLTAVVRFFGNLGGQGPCPACLFGLREWRDHDANVRQYSCDGTAHDPSLEGAGVVPTRSLSFLCAMSADLATNQVIRHALRLGRSVCNTAVEYNGYTHRTVVVPMRRNSNCPCEHVQYRVVRSARPIPDLSIRELVETAGANHKSHDLLLQIPDMRWVDQMKCKCGAVTVVRHFQPFGDLCTQKCQTCKRIVVAGPMDASGAVATVALDSVLDVPIRRLGVRALSHATLRDANRVWLVVPAHHDSPQ